MDIASSEWGNGMLTASSTTYQQKFYVGVHLEKVHNDKLSFSGIPSNQQAITVRANIGNGTLVAGVSNNLGTVSIFNMQLVFIVDAVLVIDFENQTTRLSFM
jgi:hypothetical protein